MKKNKTTTTEPELAPVAELARKIYVTHREAALLLPFVANERPAKHSNERHQLRVMVREAFMRAYGVARWDEIGTKLNPGITDFKTGGLEVRMDRALAKAVKTFAQSCIDQTADGVAVLGGVDADRLYELIARLAPLTDG